MAHYWTVHWDLRGHAPVVVETVPHPNVHLVFEPTGAATVSGVYSSRFSKVLEGKSWAVGVKFRPGGFRPFYTAAVSTLANRTFDARRIFGDAVQIKPTRNSIDEFLLARLPARDEAVETADRLVDQILKDPDIRTVDQLAALTGLGKRSLQRLFNLETAVGEAHDGGSF